MCNPPTSGEWRLLRFFFVFFEVVENPGPLEKGENDKPLKLKGMLKGDNPVGNGRKTEVVGNEGKLNLGGAPGGGEKVANEQYR